MATGRHTFTFAKNVFRGHAYHPGHQGGQRGVEIPPLVWRWWEAPVAIDADALVTKQVLSTGSSATYALGTSVAGATNALDTQSTATVKVLDYPRNVYITTSDLGGTATIRIEGYDEYGVSMWERILVTASDSTVCGKKAFGRVLRVVSNGAGGPSGTFYVGIGRRFGLPYRLWDRTHIVQLNDGGTLSSDNAASDITFSTLTATENHSATAIGVGVTDAGVGHDIRGTWKPATTPNAARNYSFTYVLRETDEDYRVFGATQAAS